MDNDFDTIIKNMKNYDRVVVQRILDDKVDLRDIPEFLVTQKVALNAIVKNVANFELIPWAKRDNIICLAACQIQTSYLVNIPEERSSWVNTQIKKPLLQFVADDLKTDIISFTFIKLDCKNISFVPDDKKRNRAFIEKACKMNPHILNELEPNEVDRELCNIAIGAEDFSLNCLPVAWRTKENCISAFAKDYREIINFPSEFITYKYIDKAISQCGAAETRNILKLLPVTEWDDHLIIECIKKDDSILKEIPYEMITQKLMFEIAPYIRRFEHMDGVPETVYTPVLAQRLVTENPMLLGAIPLPLRTRTLCIEAVAQNGMALQFAPKVTQTDEMYRIAVGNDGMALKFVPQPYRDDNIPNIAIQQNGEAIQYVPNYTINEVLCRQAILKNPQAIFAIPKEFRTQELFNLAIRSVPNTLKLIPSDARTVDQCIIAIQQNPEMFDYVPVHVREVVSFQNEAVKLGLMKKREEIN